MVKPSRLVKPPFSMPSSSAWLHSRTNTSLRAAGRWKTYVVMKYQSA